MLISTQHVIDASGAEGVNIAAWLHGESWSPEPSRNFDAPSTRPVFQAFALRPGGNRVRAYLDFVAPDDTSRRDLHAAIQSIPDRMDVPPRFPIQREFGPAGFRFGLELGLQADWEAELDVLIDRASAASQLFSRLEAGWRAAAPEDRLTPLESESLKNAANAGDTTFVIGLLRDCARQGRIQSLHNAMRHYTRARPDNTNTWQFLVGLLPGVLANNLFPELGMRRFDSFVQWTLENPRWADDIRAAARESDEALDSVVKGIIAQL